MHKYNPMKYIASNFSSSIAKVVINDIVYNILKCINSSRK